MTEWQTGMGAFREGRLREATDRLRSAAAEQERTVSQSVRYQTLAYLGAASYALGQIGEAVRAFETARLLCPTPSPSRDLLVNLANAYLATGRRQEAQSTLEEALRRHPGDMEIGMLLSRLQNRSGTDQVTGAVLGETPESVIRFVNTLSFSTVSSGYSPDQVRAALSQIQHYVEFLASQIAARDHTITQNAAEIERLRMAEDGLIRSMMQAQQEAEQLRNSQFLSEERPAAGTDQPELTPLEKLFQKKV